MTRFTQTQLVALLLALLPLAHATLSVYNLQALGENNPALLDIPYSIANFGFVPYAPPHPATARPSWRVSWHRPTSTASASSTPTTRATTVPPPAHREQLPADPARRLLVRD